MITSQTNSYCGREVQVPSREDRVGTAHLGAVPPKLPRLAKTARSFDLAQDKRGAPHNLSADRGPAQPPVFVFFRTHLPPREDSCPTLCAHRVLPAHDLCRTHPGLARSANPGNARYILPRVAQALLSP